jgi:FMN phosphatase YigB (HAD superfamily)
MNTIWITRRVRETMVRIEARPDAIVSTLSEIPPLLPR